MLPNKKKLTDLFKTIQYYIKWVRTRNKSPEMAVVRKAMGDTEFKKEMCTIHLSLPRRAGNSTLALMIFQHYPNPLFFANNEGLAGAMRERIKKGDKNRILSINSDKYIGWDVSMVIVDNAQYLTAGDLRKIYGIYSDLFIFLG